MARRIFFILCIMTTLFYPRHAQAQPPYYAPAPIEPYYPTLMQQAENPPYYPESVEQPYYPEEPPLGQTPYNPIPMQEPPIDQPPYYPTSMHPPTEQEKEMARAEMEREEREMQLQAEIIGPTPVGECPSCCAMPGCYPSAPAHGLNCGLTIPGMIFPFILVAGVAAIILATGEGYSSH